MAITPEAASPGKIRERLRLLLSRILDRAIDRLIDVIVVVAIPAAFLAIVAICLVWGAEISDWLGESVSNQRWVLAAIIVTSLATPILGHVAVERVNKRRLRMPHFVSIAATPATFDLSGVGHGSTTLTVTVTDDQGRPAKSAKVEVWAYSYVPSYQSTNPLRTDKHGRAYLTLLASPTMLPGILVVRAFVLRSNALPLEATADVTCVGSPAFLTMAAAPNKVIVGEASTILATVTDALNQAVFDTTKVHLTSSTGLMEPADAETFGGVATSKLLTNAPGPCTIVATIRGLPGSPPVSSQVTVEAFPPIANPPAS